MQIRAKEVRRKVKLLEDPQPGWMALVDNGANQTPFNVVKRDSIKRKGKEKDDMARKGKGSKAPDARLTKMQLSKDKFPTTKAVKKYLEENDIEGVGNIEDGDDVWIVKSDEDFSDLTLGKAKSTATKHDGVTAFIAPVLKGGDPEEEDDAEEEGDGEEEDDGEAESTSKDDDADDDDDDGEDDDGEEEEEVEPKGKKAASKVKDVDGTKTKVRRAPKPKKAAKVEPVLEFPGELAQKYDFYGAYLSNNTSLTGVISDGMGYDDVPPGVEEVMMAAYHTIGNVLGGDDDAGEKKAKLVQLGNDIANLTFGLFELFDKATEDSTKSASAKTRKAAAAFVDSFSASIDRAADGETAIKLFDNVDNDDEEDDEKKPTKKAAKAKDEADGVPLWARNLITSVKGLAGKVGEIDDTLARGTKKRSMSDSLDEIVGDDDEDETDEEAASRLEEVRRSMGLRGPAIGSKETETA